MSEAGEEFGIGERGQYDAVVVVIEVESGIPAYPS